MGLSAVGRLISILEAWTEQWTNSREAGLVSIVSELPGAILVLADERNVRFGCFAIESAFEETDKQCLPAAEPN